MAAIARAEIRSPVTERSGDLCSFMDTEHLSQLVENVRESARSVWSSLETSANGIWENLQCSSCLARDREGMVPPPSTFGRPLVSVVHREVSTDPEQRGVLGRVWEKASPHLPLIGAISGLVLVLGLGYMYASAETFNTTCFRDAADKTVAWCAKVASSDDISKVSFEKFQGIRNWVPSQDLMTKSYESVKGGSQFVYNTWTEYFVNNPLVVAKDFFTKLVS